MYSITVYHIKSSSGISNVRFVYDHLKWKHPKLWNFPSKSCVWFLNTNKNYKSKLNKIKKQRTQIASREKTMAVAAAMTATAVVFYFSNTQNTHMIADMAVRFTQINRCSEWKCNLCWMHQSDAASQMRQSERARITAQIQFLCGFKLTFQNAGTSFLFNFFRLTLRSAMIGKLTRWLKVLRSQAKANHNSPSFPLHGIAFGISIDSILAILISYQNVLITKLLPQFFPWILKTVYYCALFFRYFCHRFH